MIASAMICCQETSFRCLKQWDRPVYIYILNSELRAADGNRMQKYVLIGILQVKVVAFGACSERYELIY